MIELNEAALSAAMRELNREKQAAVDQTFDVVAEHARGKSAAEVLALLRAELGRRGVEPDDDLSMVAKQIAAAVEGRR